jgi:dipeptidyl aminopeptidase/acylaminoacyl peptidase
MRIIVLLAAVFLAQALAQAQFTLEQIMGAPFVSDLTTAPKGNRIAWVASSRGIRNIWVTEGPAFRARCLTAYANDDGQELSDLHWTPDATSLVYVRGGGGNPNPLSRPEGAEQALWIVPFDEGAPRRLDEGAAPAVSPKGDRVAYLKKGQIWAMGLKDGQTPARIVEARGTCATLRWSGDGARLAFVSDRTDHSFIGVYDPPAGSVRYLDPSVDRDTEPAWSPDGKSIAFQRTPNARVLLLFGPKRSAEPWSIRVADVTSGRGREIWRANKGRGNVFRAVEARSQLIWAAGDRIVFPWEGDGWTHLYSVAASGGEILPLTPGEGEVEHVSLSSDRREIFYSSNQGDLDRRHIWRVPASGGKAVRVTSGDGIEWSPAGTAEGGALALLRSNARRPGWVAILVSGTLMDVLGTAPAPDFPEQVLVAPEAVTFKSPDGMEIHAQLFRPARLQISGRQPAVIFFHGGPRRQMLLGWHFYEYYHNAYAFNQFLASRGYLVLSVNYRSGTGYGMEFREALRYGAVGASEFNDVLGAASYLRSRTDVDASRIAMWGGSYGGYLTALGLARASEQFRAGVDLHGVHDWRTETKLFLPSDDLEVQQAASRLALESSPMAHVKTWRSPVLLIHGDDDRNVEFRQTVQLVEALRGQGVEFEQLIFPDEVHAFLTHSSWREAFWAAADFLDRKLSGPRP